MYKIIGNLMCFFIYDKITTLLIWLAWGGIIQLVSSARRPPTRHPATRGTQRTDVFGIQQMDCGFDRRNGIYPGLSWGKRLHRCEKKT